ncbi:hypothetical protein LAZ67_3005353 [Cordylochernes scorpioides]|uniref:Transposase n=1 Tax=Cordylochernes scorpioides TaxID=51811 RepID=A0ABY6KA86_9ARAC|nr:hypothetical protein LAZ67_3005353 [Cordylochernes scorpioides]
MLITIFDSRGIIHKEFVPAGQTITGEYYLNFLKRLIARIRRIRPEYRDEDSWCLLHDNAPSHSSLIVRRFLAKNNVCVLNHPPYSLYLAPCDFYLFPKIKLKLKVYEVQTRQTTLDAGRDKDLHDLILALSTKIDDFGKKMETRLVSVEQGLNQINQRLQHFESSLETTSEAVSLNTNRISDLKRRLELGEMRQREKNLIIYGLEGAESETPEESRGLIQDLISNTMQISEDLKIEQCRRLIKKANSPLLIEVPDLKQRILLFRNTFRLRDKKIFINKDYPPTIRDQRRILISKRKELMSKGNVSKLRDNRLIVRGISYSVLNGRVISSNGDAI